MSCGTNATTIPSLLAATVASRGNSPALAAIQNSQVSWQTWRELAVESQRQAAAMKHTGMGPGEAVAHVSENRREWVITDLAIHLAGGIHVPIHVTLPAERIAEQICHSDAKLVFVSTGELAHSIKSQVDPTVCFVVYEPEQDPSAEIISRSEFVKRGHASEVSLESAATHTKGSDLATILYTSGTTGQPRGVMLTQANLAGNAVAVSDIIGIDRDELRLGFLPLSHIYARTCDFYSWLYVGSRLALAENRETVLQDCQLVRPTAINAVPYFYQKLQDRLATDSDDERAALRAALGGNLSRCFSGGAALAPDVEKWFADLGLPILVGYGLTETSPVVSVSTTSARRLGSVGKPLPEVKVRVAKDGEVLVQGANVMQGYFRDEAESATAIREGWFHTGDLGAMDEDGFLFIKGRKKEIIVLSTGKNVSPTRVEGLLAASPLIEQVAVVGDERSHLAALIVPNADALQAEFERRSITTWPRQDALRSEEVRAVIAEEISRRLQSSAREEQVHAFTLIDRSFSIELGELTPKFSLCREVINEAFREEIAAMYASS